MKNNDKFFKKAAQKINRKIENKSGIRFSFNSFKLHLNIYLYQLYYKLLHLFLNKDFHDGFVISFVLHLIFILGVIIYTVLSGKLYLGVNRNIKQEKVVIFDLSDLKVDKKDSLPKLTKLNLNKAVDNIKKKSIKTVSKSIKNNYKTLSNVDSSYNLKEKNDNSIKTKKKKNDEKTNKIKKSDIKDMQDDLLVNVKKGIQAETIEDINIPAGAVSKDEIKNDLQISYISAVKFRVQNCWNIDAGIKGIQNIVVRITVSLFETGYVKSIDILNSGEYNNSNEFNVVADSARRAIVSCAPYKFSIERYNYWKTINFNFYPDKKSVE